MVLKGFGTSEVKTTLETSEDDVNYTWNENTTQTTLETSEDDVNYTWNEWRRRKLHSKRVKTT
jgi:hypothetical protein